MSKTLIMNRIEALIENHFYEDAYKLLATVEDKTNIDYMFHLVFLEAQLGQSEEVITLFTLSQMDVGRKRLATIHGFAADILHNEGFTIDAIYI